MSTRVATTLMYGVKMDANEYTNNFRLDSSISFLTIDDPIIAEHGDFVYVGHAVSTMETPTNQIDGITELYIDKSLYEKELDDVFSKHDLVPRYMIVCYPF